MQSDSNAVSHHLCTTTEDYHDLHVNQYAKPDTRRFASIFPLVVPAVVPADRNYATPDSYDDFYDDLSRRQLVAAPSNNTSSTQVQAASVASVDTPNEAQQVIACYRAVHGGGHASDYASTEINEGLSHVPDDRRSIYTIATSMDTQPMMDMMWRLKPKVHMHRADQRALIQAVRFHSCPNRILCLTQRLQQSQAIAMMHNAGLKPTSKIQCRRRDCADILPGVEALKYHIHIHNIADSAAKCADASSSAACETSLVQHSTSKTSKSTHSRPKPTLRPQKCSMAFLSSRKLSASNFLPPLLSPSESTPEAQHVPSLVDTAKSYVSNRSTSKSANPLPMCNNNETCCTIALTSPRGRRARKESLAVSVGSDSPSIAMLLSSPPPPDMYGRVAVSPNTDFPIPVALRPAMDDESDNHTVTPTEKSHKVPEKLTGSRGPIRALSPTRAMSPIRSKNVF